MKHETDEIERSFQTNRSEGLINNLISAKKQKTAFIR